MVIDLREMPDAARRQYDVCIIGAGAAGITLARTLASPRRSICLLESGGFDFDEDIQSLYDGRADGPILHPTEYLRASRLRYFGGTTNHWNGMCRPLDELDFALRDWVPNSGWPITRTDLEPFYKQAAPILEFSPFDATWGDLSAEPDSIIPPGGPFLGRMFHFSPPTRFGLTYREELARARMVDVLLHANVVGLDVNDRASVVEQVRVAGPGGRHLTIQARQVVLAAGGVENARLLLSSDSVQQTGLGNGSDCVGRYFMEHPELVPAQMLVSDGGAFGTFQMLQERWAVLCPSGQTQRAEGLLNAGIQFFGGGPEASEAGGRPLDIREEVSLIDRGSPALTPEDDQRAPLPIYMRLFVRCESAPSADNRVTLEERDTDALGMRRARLTFAMGALETRTVLQTLDLLARELGVRQAGRLLLLDPEEIADVGLGAPPWREVAGGSHHVGTTRMSDDPAKGVVDQNCRVHGIENLFVAGSSVFPTCGMANPTFTIVALALRLAAHLSARLET